MTADKERISMKQAIFLFLTITFSPAIRLIPAFGASEAKQAAWLAPLVSCIALALLVILLQRMVKNKSGSFMEIIYDVAGTVMGKILIMLYLIWVTILLAMYVRYYAERIVSTIFPDTSISVFIIAMLVFVAYVLHDGIVSIARMNEIIFPVIVVIFFILGLFILPKVEVDNLLPVSSLDILPVLKASTGLTAIWVYLLFLFFIGDKIKHKEKTKKAGIQAAVFLLIANFVLLAMTIGTLGYSVAERLPLPFMITVKQISVFEILQKIESVVVTLWIASDFIIITVFAYIALQMMKSLFKLSETKPLINIYLVLIYFLTLYLAKSIFELEDFSRIVAIPVNILLGFIMPFIIFAVAKVRRKTRNLY